MEKNPYPEFDLSGKVAIITGAGRGMGYHFAMALARYGADVVICSRTRSELEKVAAEIRQLGRRALIQQLDVTKSSEIQAMVEAAVKEFGKIDILVNNAGLGVPQWAEDVTEEAWDRVMIKQKRGKIINISSQSGSVGLIMRAVYCASKGGVNLLTKVLALEWAKHNILVNAIAPTFVETPLTKPMLAKDEFRNYVLGNILLGRIGQPQDVIGALIYLASDAANLVTGHVLLVDGGWTAH